MFYCTSNVLVCIYLLWIDWPHPGIWASAKSTGSVEEVPWPCSPVLQSVSERSVEQTSDLVGRGCFHQFDPWNKQEIVLNFQT